MLIENNSSKSKLFSIREDIQKEQPISKVEIKEEKNAEYNKRIEYKAIAPVNIRKEPSTTSILVGGFKKGEHCFAIKEEDGWIKTEKGWSMKINFEEV